MTHVRNTPEMFTRAYTFEMRSTPGSDGRTLEGYVAMFRSVSRIPDRSGDFDEELHPGFADRSLRENGFPVMQFDHGKDPRVGTVPIGRYDVFEPDAKGYFVRGRLFDNAVVEPVRQAIEGRAIKGMSFRFSVTKGGDKWNRRSAGVDKRDIFDADVPEAGPVVFPAYAATSVSVRSLLATYTDEERAALVAELVEQVGRAVDLSSLAGQSTTRSGGGGDTGAKPREGDASPRNTARDRVFRTAMRDVITLP